MRILILGGTIFVGREIVQAALDRGHEITLFHRGQRGGDLFEGRVERVRGDRDGELGKLAGGQWDAVVDTSGYIPRLVADSASFLSNATKRYLFISTISVYDADDLPRVEENSPLVSTEGLETEEVNGETYGPLKVRCEEAVRKVYGDEATIVRPGLIVGPNDSTDRFTYWPLRMHRGGDVLVPDAKRQPTQFIDVRDLASLCMTLLEREKAGVFNATGPQDPYSLGEVLERCQAVCNPSANLVWVSPERLAELGVTPWKDLPFFVDPADGYGFMRVDVSRAIAQGLSFRPLDQTIRDTLEWALSRGDAPLKAGMSAEAEAAALSAL